jgi:signal transduction histidine kinase
MKKIKANFAAKFSAWLLLAIFAFLFFLSVAGVAVLIYTGSYWDGGRNFREATAEQVFSFDRIRIRYILNEYLGENSVDDTDYRKMYDPESSNVFFVIKDTEGKVIVDYNSDEEYIIKYEYEEFVKSAKTEKNETLTFDTLEEAQSYIEALENDHFVSEWYYSSGELEVTYYDYDSNTYTVSAYIRKNFTARDRYFYTLRAVDIVVSMRYWIILIGIISAVICLIIMVFLCSAAGCVDENHRLVFIHRIPLDVYFLICLFVTFAMILCFEAMSLGDEYEWLTVLMFMFVSTCSSLIIASAVVTFAARVKGVYWWRNTFIYRFFVGLKKLLKWLLAGLGYVFKCVPLFWKAMLFLILLKLVELVFLLSKFYAFALFWLIESIIMVMAVVYIAIALRKLQKAAHEIAHGDLEYRTDIKYMPQILKEHGENLNNIGEGLKAALDEKVKSEHMKAELIANVSHDIKTPLTSIVNYVGLLKKEGVDCASSAEYLDVLERQSIKLKKLTDDLIEASKATSGCVNVNSEDTDINVLLAQASGEYEDKFAQNDLIPVLSLDENNPIIYVDGGLLWRVFDNLLNNICKYSQKGTRVYLKSEVHDGKVTVMFSNISAAQLNISSEELMERFVRGDASRNTEGSGLGLSIARSLIELQGGCFDIKIDGDLFKVEMIFEIIEEQKSL